LQKQTIWETGSEQRKAKEQRKKNHNNIKNNLKTSLPLHKNKNKKN